jgi:hypothetical protein
MEEESKVMWRFSGLQRVALLLTAAGLAFSALSCAVAASHKGSLWWLFLYFPVLWVLWLVSVFVSPRIRGNAARLMVLWVLIDAAILLALISLGEGKPAFSQAQGADAVAFVAYFPVVVPLALLVGLLPDTVAHYLLHSFDFLGSILGSVGEIVALWIDLSILAGVQSWLFAMAVYRWRRMRELRSVAH